MNLQALCESKGVEYIDRGNGHIQLKGPLLVNYYPESKKSSAYVAGTKHKVTHVKPAQAVAMCFKAPKSQGVADKRSRNTRNIRKAILKKRSTCYWCEAPLTLDTSTLEHIIPIARGGLDNANNRTVACKPCNENRGSGMPELNIDN